MSWVYWGIVVGLVAMAATLFVFFGLLLQREGVAQGTDRQDR